MKFFSAVWFSLLVAAGYGLIQIFSDLGAFMHVGAIIGTVMAANVFMIIIPNQRKVVAQVLAGETPDPALGKQAKQRSVHNNYMTLPVLFIMISNHYPMIFAAPLNWLWLAGLGVAGWTIRHFFNLKNAGRSEPQVLAAGALVFVTVAVLNVAAKPKPPTVAEVPAYATVRAIVNKHCIACHAAHPTHRGVPVAPNGAAEAADHRGGPDLRRRAHHRRQALHRLPRGPPDAPRHPHGAERREVRHPRGVGQARRQDLRPGRGHHLDAPGQRDGHDGGGAGQARRLDQGRG